MSRRIGRAGAIVVACVALGGAWLANAAVAAGQTEDEGPDTEAEAPESVATSIPASPTEFHYTGDVQSYTVPAGVHELLVTTSGAEGGDGGGCRTNIPEEFDCGEPGDGGKGATVTTSVAVTPGQTLSVFVGGEGEDGEDFQNIITDGAAAGAGGGIFGSANAADSAGPGFGFMEGGDGGWGYGEGGDGATGFGLGGSGGGGAGGSAVLSGDTVLVAAAGGGGGGGSGANDDISAPNGAADGGDGGESAEDGDEGQAPCEGEGGEAGSESAEGEGGEGAACPPLSPGDSAGTPGDDGDDGDGPDGGDGGQGNLDAVHPEPDIQGAGGGGGGGGVLGGGGGGAGGANDDYAAGTAGGGGGGGDFCPAGGVAVDGDHGGNGVVSIVPVVTVEPKFTG